MAIHSRLRSHIRARRLQRLYADFIAAGDLVFDVGANVGERVSVFRNLGARVVAIEPQASCIQQLQERWGDDDYVVVEPIAVAASEGQAELHVADASTISTMAPEWMAATSKTRFAGHEWNAVEVVATTTLDRLIARHGVPSFCKIDVEGFELEVLRGLSRALPTISFEYASEVGASAAACVRRLDELGMNAYNLSVGETGRLASRRWLDSEALVGALEELDDPLAWGDVYART